MLKKLRKSQICVHETNLMDIINNPKNHMKREDIMQLFTPQHRQVFELDYLYKSPHYTEYPAYCELIHLLENYNEQTISLRNSNSITCQIDNFNRTKLACIRLIYREMLSISKMAGWQMRCGDLASRLLNWYDGLMNRHSFLEGVNIKRRNHSKQQQTQIEKDIRSKYMSNVYDEINDYLRKKFDYTSTIGKQNFNGQNNNKAKKQLNLPYIDSLIYRRQDARMREYREKEIQQRYMNIMIKNKQKMRETSLLRTKNKYNVRQKIAITEHREQSQQSINTTFATQPYSFSKITRQSSSQQKLYKTKVQFFNRKQTLNNKLVLNNINGINLINYKPE